MLISEKVAYLNGLFDGLEIDEKKKEGKVLKGILEILADISLAIEDLEVDVEELNEGLCDTFDDIEEIYSELDEDCDFLEEEDDEDGCGCGNHSHDELYEVVCPTCKEIIFFDADTLDEGSMACHACGEDLEFDLTDLDNEEEDTEDAE